MGHCNEPHEIKPLKKQIALRYVRLARLVHLDRWHAPYVIWSSLEDASDEAAAQSQAYLTVRLPDHPNDPDHERRDHEP